MNSGTLADAAGSLAAGHVGQGGVAGAAGNLDRLVREGEGGVKEVKIQCGDVAFSMISYIFTDYLERGLPEHSVELHS